MANYANILAEITAAITTNDSQDITGAVLRNVLEDMVAALGAGYQYKGIASPATNPGTVDQRVFYLAPPGTYQYFGPATVPDGMLGILTYDTAWSLSLIDLGVGQLLDDVYGTPSVPINVAAITSCGGFIEENGTWSATGNDQYYGGLVDVTQYRGRRVKIVSSGGGSYAFTTAGFSRGNPVQFATGWTHRELLGPAGAEYVLPIPSDAVYLFVYLDSPGVSYRPREITILAANSALQDIDDLWAEMANVYNEMAMAGRAGKHIDVAGLSSCGGFILADGTWSATGNDQYYGGLVPVTNFRGCGYKLVSSGGGSFAFVTSGFSKGDPVSFATGWTGRALFGDAGTEYTGTVPDDAVYLFVYLDSPGTTYRPREITFYVTIDVAIAEMEQQIAQGSVADSLSIMAWNLGHFSGGAQPNSTITAAQYPEKVDGFRAVLSSERPDVYGLSEYSAIFGKNASNVNVNTKDELFNFEQTYFESTQMHYTCYAMFSGFGVPVYNVKINDYDCLADETISHTTLMEAQDFRYISADLYAFGVPIRLVVTHMAFDLNRPGVLTQKQFNELINKYADDDYVIIMGDFNVSSVSEYDTFVAAGYSLANDGRFLTYRTGGTPLDNIVAKGLTIFDAKMVSTDLSDHNALLCKVSK